MRLCKGSTAANNIMATLCAQRQRRCSAAVLGKPVKGGRPTAPANSPLMRTAIFVQTRHRKVSQYGYGRVWYVTQPNNAAALADVLQALEVRVYSVEVLWFAFFVKAPHCSVKLYQTRPKVTS